MAKKFNLNDKMIATASSMDARSSQPSLETIVSGSINYTPDQIKVDHELKSFLPVLPKEEQLELRRSIIEKGILTPLDIWQKVNGDLILIDGYNRYELAKEFGLSFRIVIHAFDNIDEVKLWMIRNQKTRRNLTSWDFFIGQEYELLKGDTKNLAAKYLEFKEAIEIAKKKKIDLDKTAHKTAALLGIVYNKSVATVRRAHNYFLGIRKIHSVNRKLANDLKDLNVQLDRGFIEYVGTKEIDLPKDVTLDDLQKRAQKWKGKGSGNKKAISVIFTKVKAIGKVINEQEKANLKKELIKLINEL